MQWWKNLSIRSKFVGGILVVFVVTVISSVSFIVSLNGISGDVQKLGIAYELNQNF